MSRPLLCSFFLDAMLPFSYRIARKILIKALARMKSFLDNHQELSDVIAQTVLLGGSSAHLSDLKFAISLLQPFDNGFELSLIGDGCDGSYLIPNDDFQSLHGVISPGVGTESSFEDFFLSNFCSKVVAIDPTVKVIPSALNAQGCTYVNKFLASRESSTSISLPSVVSKHFPNATTASLVLQLDIEGAEYLSLLATPSAVLDKFRFVVLELHDLDSLRSPTFIHCLYLPLILKLNSLFDVLHFHPNNACPQWDCPIGQSFPSVVEVTWHHKSRSLVQDPLPRTSHLHPLDVLNSLSQPPHIVDFSLFTS